MTNLNNATLTSNGGVLDTTVGMHTATFTANEGSTFPGDSKTLDVQYQVEGPDTTQCPTNSCPAQTNGGTATNLNLNGWNPAFDTRSAGHWEFVDGGLHIYTDDATSNAKVSWAKAVSFPLANTGTLSVEYVASLGVAPGINLFVDFDNNGSVDGTLVYESVYGQDLWLTNGSAQFVKDAAPVNGGGNGSQWHGTINQWLTKFPTAQVQGIAFALGSGVHGDGVLNWLSVGCAEYGFDYVASPEPLAGEDVTHDVDCETETYTTETTPWTQGWVIVDGQWVLGEKVYGETVTDEREATAAELNEYECPAPEEPKIDPTVVVKEILSCEAEQVTIETTTTTPTHSYDEVTRTWVRGEDEVVVTNSLRDKTDLEDAACVISSGVLASTGATTPFIGIAGALGLLVAGGAVLIARRKVSAE